MLGAEQKCMHRWLYSPSTQAAVYMGYTCGVKKGVVNE